MKDVLRNEMIPGLFAAKKNKFETRQVKFLPKLFYINLLPLPSPRVQSLTYLHFILKRSEMLVWRERHAKRDCRQGLFVYINFLSSCETGRQEKIYLLV